MVVRLTYSFQLMLRMCILFLLYSPHEGDYRLIAANNRDEVFERPTASVGFWEDHPGVLAGRDLLTPDGGTWFGVTKNGRFSVLTNYRTQASQLDSQAHTRGHLVSDFLTGTSSPVDYCRHIEGQRYNGFSLITTDLSGDGGAVYLSNRDPDGVRVLRPGTYGLSNSLLDTPWLKVERGRSVFSDIVSSPEATLTDRLFTLLSDDTSYCPDPSIPDTGFSEEVSKNTSAIFVNPCSRRNGMYGTRTQTVLLVGQDGNVTYTERTLSQDLQWTTNTHSFKLLS